MLFFITYQIYRFDFRDENQEVLINCSSYFRVDFVIPRTVKEIYSESRENHAFKNCRGAIRSIKFEENSEIVSISNYSFYNTLIESADLSNCNQLTLLNRSIFSDCEHLKTVLLPQCILSIGIGCFLRNYALISIVLPDSVETIYEWAFSYSGLTTINISKNSKLNKLDSGCFSDTNLSTFFIPKSLNEIYPSAFHGCQYLNYITVDPENMCYRSDSTSLFSGVGNSTLFRVFSIYSDSEYIVPIYVTNISDNCFSYVNISSIQLHDKITRIEDLTFSHCTSLTNITIPESVTYIGRNAFTNCKSLTNIKIPESVTYIGSGAFINCISLTNITIPGSVTYFGRMAFRNCKSLNTVTFLNNVNSIITNSYLFTGTQKLNIYIPGRFVLNDKYNYSKIFPTNSTLYITSQTVLSDKCRNLFGEKSVHVHFDSTTKLSDQTTIDVLQYISIESISIPLGIPKTKRKKNLYRRKIFHLTNFIISLNIRAAS